jgi:PKD repeat protein
MPVINIDVIQIFNDVSKSYSGNDRIFIPLAVVVPNWTFSEMPTKERENNTVTLAHTKPQTLVPDQYSTTVYVNTTKEMLSNIDNVTYLLHSSFKPNDKVTKDSARDNFSYSFSAGGEFTIRAKIQFNNGQVLERRLPIEVGPGYIIPPDIILNEPKTEGLKTTISGEVISAKNITRIAIDWGDGTSQNGTFPLFNMSHTYSKPDLYTITITTYDDERNLSASKSMQDTVLLLENILKNETSIDIDTKTKSILKMDDIYDVIGGDPEEEFSVSGRLSYLNGSGIDNVPIVISIHGNINKPTITAHTEDGVYSVQIPLGLKFPKGTYSVSAQPTEDSTYSDLKVFRDFNAVGHELTLNELITYVGGIVAIGGTILGVIIKVPDYFKEKKQRSNFCSFVAKINNIYDISYRNKKELLEHLNEIRNDVLRLLNRGEIDQEQYQILEEKISKYTDEMNQISEMLPDHSQEQ